MNGNGIYQEFDLKFKFEGILNKDDLVEGKLSSYYIQIEGLFDDFVFRKGQAVLHFTDGYVFKGKFDNQGVNGYGVLEFPDGQNLSGEWKDGTLGDYCICHGDKNKRFHRLCLLEFKAKNSKYFNEKTLKEENDGTETEITSMRINVEGSDDFFTLRTLKLYDKRFDLSRIDYNRTEYNNVQVKKTKGKVTNYTLNYGLIRYEKISNPQTYGSKQLNEVNYMTGDVSWTAYGQFNEEEYTASEVKISFRNLINFEADILYGNVTKLDYNFKKDPLGFKDIGIHKK